MSEETDYFLVEGGTAKKHLDEYLSGCRAAYKRRKAFLKKHKAKTLYVYDGYHAVASVVFEKDPDPALWKPAKKCSGWVPRRTTAEGKATYKELFGTFPRASDDDSKTGLSLPDFPSVAARIIGTGAFFWGMRRYYAGFKYLDGDPVIMLAHPFGDKPPPKPVNTKNHWAAGYEIKLVDGVRQLKASEYWKIKEKAETKKVSRRAG